MKDLICENIKEYEFIQKFLNLEVFDKSSKKTFPILLFKSRINNKTWLFWLNNYIEDKKHCIYVKNIIRKEKLKRINNG